MFRDIVDRVVATQDVWADAAQQLDMWSEATHVADILTVEGTSYWYQRRQRHAMWLIVRSMHSAILAELVATVRPAGIECATGLDPDLVDAARAIARRDGLTFRDEGAPPETAEPARPRRRREPLMLRFHRRLDRLLGRRPPVDERTRRRQQVAGQLGRLAQEPGRLLAVLAHARQSIETPDGVRSMNPYLGPIIERLRATSLDPIEVDLRLAVTDAGWTETGAAEDDRRLPSDVLAVVAPDVHISAEFPEANAIVARLAALRQPLVVDGIDLGPELAGRVVEDARRFLAVEIRQYRRVRRLLARLRPAGILLADEYHHQAWLAAARAEGVRTAAVQHGLIYRWHNGYIHPSRPAGLRLPDRTYVFGRWERDLLTEAGVYRADEVVVGGSPRLDLIRPEPVDRAAVRAALGVDPADRLLVLSGTWAPMYRQFFYPAALARLFDRPMPGVHLVVKLHPHEPDDGPYRAVIEGVACARGFEPPRISVIGRFDLYQLLGAADAHLGIHSTVLTEAVVAGTRNLIAATFAASDLLGYVDAGVARPVRDGGDILAALEAPLETLADDARRRDFLEAHFEPGSASARIAGDLRDWLA